MLLISLAVLLAVIVVDWPQLGTALESLSGQPWLVGLFVASYTGAFVPESDCVAIIDI